MCRILPTYRSVCAQISSYPQGLSTRVGWLTAIVISLLENLLRLRAQAEELKVKPKICLVGIGRPVDGKCKGPAFTLREQLERSAIGRETGLARIVVSLVEKQQMIGKMQEAAESDQAHDL